MKSQRVVIFTILLLMLFSCNSRESIDLSNIKLNNKLVRFDSLFYENGYSLELKEKYPLMFPQQFSDSIWFEKYKDSLDLAVYRETKEVFGDFNSVYEEVEDVLKRFKYYFPGSEIPDVYSIISDFDYKFPVLLSQGRMFISLDMYLGSDSYFYEEFPSYLRYNFRKERLTVDVAIALARSIVHYDRKDKSLLNEMLLTGRVDYIASKLLKEDNDALLLGYSQDQEEWCENNQFEIWSYLVKRKYLYSNEYSLRQRFLESAPFTKFYLALDRESPGRVGEWLGYQIVKSFAKYKSADLNQIANFTNAEMMLKESKYKPGK